MGHIVTTEDAVHKQVCSYIRLQYPNVMFNVDMSGIKLPIGLAKKVKNLRSERGYPDVSIYESKGGHHGLFLELKKPGAKIYRNDGRLLSNPHIHEQWEVIRKLRQRKYYADFAIGFHDAKEKIDWYMNLS